MGLREARHLVNTVSQVSLGFWLVVSAVTFLWFSRPWGAGFALGAVAGVGGILYAAKSASKLLYVSPSKARNVTIIDYFIRYGLVAAVLVLAALWNSVDFIATAISLISIRIILIVFGFREAIVLSRRQNEEGG
jgi:hypothetical protein